MDPGLGTIQDDVYQGQTAAVIADRFVLSGAHYEDETPVIWHSSDGLAWEEGSLEGAVPGDLVYDLTAGENGGVAVGWVGGYGESVGAIWWTGDGRTWNLTHDPEVSQFVQSHVAALDGDYLVSGDDQLYWSADGRDWEELPWDAPGIVNELVAADGHVTALVRAQDGPITLWRSSDGHQWEDVGVLPRSRNASIDVAVVGSQGWVVVGTDQDGAPSAWFSRDGEHFEVVDASRFPDMVSDVLADDSGFIGVGVDITGQGCALDPAEIEGVTITSPDGITWTRMPGDGWQHKRIEELLRVRRTLIGVGLEYRESEDFGLPVGTIWTAPLPRLDRKPPAQEPLPSLGPGGCGENRTTH